MKKEGNWTRDFVLGILSALGISMLVSRTLFFVGMLWPVSAKDILLYELVLYSLAVFLAYQKVKLSNEYRNWLVRIAIIVFVAHVLMGLSLFA